MKKRMVALLLTTVMAATALAGCGGGSDSSGGSTGGSGGTSEEGTGEDGGAEASTDPVTFTFYNADGKEDLWDDPVAEAITAATGVSLKTDYPVDGNDQMVSLMIAEGSYPDLIFAKGDGSALIEAGALLDLTDLIEEHGPNIKKLYGDYYTRLRYTEEDPAIYQLCANAVGGERYTESGNAQLQFAVLEANDYQVPNSLDELEKYLKDYIAENPQVDGLDTIGISLSTADWHWMITLGNPAGFIADVAPDNGQWLVYDDEDYRAVYKHTTEAEREYFRWLNRMYHEGILDPDFATQSHDDYLAKIATGRVLCLFDKDWDYNDAVNILKADDKYERTYAGLPLTMNEEDKAVVMLDQGLSVGWGVAITTDCEDPVRAIQYIDWLCTEEAQILLNWGIEDVNYFVDDDGLRYRTEEEIEYALDNDYGKETGVGFHLYPFPAYGDGVLDSTGNPFTRKTKDSVSVEYTEAEQKAVEAWGVELLVDIFPSADEFPIPDYAPVWAQTQPAEFTDYESILNDIAWPGLIQCVVADQDAFDATWDNMQENFKSAGVEQAEALLTGIIQEQVAFWTSD